MKKVEIAEIRLNAALLAGTLRRLYADMDSNTLESTALLAMSLEMRPCALR